MKRLLLFVLLATPGFADEAVEPLSPAQVRALLREARTLYASEDTEELGKSAELFGAAAEAADPGEVHVDAVRLAEAQAWLKADQPQRALEAFEQIQGFEQAADRARHRMLRGNAQLLLGEQALAEEDFEAAKEQMNQAIESFVESLMEDPRSEDAKRNLEIANRRLQYVIENEPPPPEPPTKEEDEEKQDPPEEPPPEEQESEPESGEGESEPQEQESDPSEGEDQGEPQPGDPQEGEGEPSDPQEEPGEPEEPGEAESMEGELDDLSEEEAGRTLDALLEQERRLREEILQNRRLRTIPVEKDW